VPSLECLCQQTGSSGYTIGEGATECIVAENDINNCVGMAFGCEHSLAHLFPVLCFLSSCGRQTVHPFGPSCN
jgi:hypothetical protein